MIDGLKPYPAYKNSGLPWLGEIPTHWSVQRAKTVFGCIDVRSENGGEELLTVSSERGIVPRRSASVTMFKAASYQGHKLCWPGDLVINSLWAWARGLGVSRYHGIVSTAYSVYRLRDGNDFEPDFIHELLRSVPFHWELFVRSKGVWISRLQLNNSAFLDAPLVKPPKDEQLAIVRFLRYEDVRIKRLIRAKQKLITLLEEEKQVIIYTAVTRGIDPSVQLKKSGVHWLAEVPEHWEVKPLKYLVPQVTVGIVVQPARLYVDSGIPCLRSLNISSGSIKDEDVVFISKESNVQNRKSQIFAGDIVVVRTGQAGVAAIVTPDFDGSNCIDLLIIRKSKNLLSEYILTFLNSWPARTDVKFRSVGAIQAHYNTGTLANLVVPVPPLTEQRMILDDLAARLTPIAQSTRIAQREIEFLRELRARLIADVVTGKLDVREVASGLPEDIAEAETLDEFNELSQDDLAAEEVEPEAAEQV